MLSVSQRLQVEASLEKKMVIVKKVVIDFIDTL